MSDPADNVNYFYVDDPAWKLFHHQLAGTRHIIYWWWHEATDTAICERETGNAEA